MQKRQDLITVQQWKLILSLIVAITGGTAFVFLTFETQSHADEAHAAVNKRVDNISVNAKEIKKNSENFQIQLQKLCLLFESSLTVAQHPYRRRSSICSERI